MNQTTMKRRKNSTIFVNTNPNAVLMQAGDQILSLEPMEFCALKQYTEQEFSLLLKTNPIFLADDKIIFEDKYYVRNMCLLYVQITLSTLKKATSIKHFYIADLERALLKLSQEHPEEYAILCKEFSINPKTRCSNNSVVNLSAITQAPVTRLASWGYAELFSPHLIDVIPKIAGKFFSAKGMSELNKAKLGHLFLTFVVTFNRMPYDQTNFEIVVKARKEKESITKNEEHAVYDETINYVFSTEKNIVFEALMLESAYNAYFKDLQDDSFNADAIMHWLDHIVDKKYKYQMLEFVDLLTEDQYEEFTQFNLSTIESNYDIRILKEQIFPYGEWATDLQTFMLKPDEKYIKAMATAYNKYRKNNFEFGNGVEKFKKPHTEQLYSTNEKVELPGYLYATAPVRLRISDKNELRMYNVCNILTKNVM